MKNLNLATLNIKYKVLITVAVLGAFSSVSAEFPGFSYAKASVAYIDQSTTGMTDRIYYGGSFGASEAESYCVDGKGWRSKSCEDKDSSWKAFAGYNINETFSAEVAYTSIGDLHKAGEFSDISALSVSALANFNINDQLGVFGKAGLSHWESENSDSKKKGTGLSYGLGAKVSLSESMKLRAEWEHLSSVSTSHKEKSDIDMMSIGIELSTL
jgi:opacity protein-like surface antigen